MKIITGINKKNLITKIKLISFKPRQISSKYHIIRHSKIIYVTYDRRGESKYNDVILLISTRSNKNQILKIIK